MDKPSAAAVLGAYIRGRRRVIVGFLAFLAIFFVVYLLYRVPLEAGLYAMLLCAVLAGLLGIADFRRFYRRHVALRDQLAALPVSLDRLPEAADLLEQDYQELAAALFRENMERVSEADQRRTDMIEYYTLWAHQIKTPIAAMRLLLQAREKDEIGAQLEQELFKTEQYVEMVLGYLRMADMSADLLLESYDLAAIVRQAVKKCAVVFIHKRISLDLRELDARVLTDEKWLVFVLEQVLSNALKYTPDGGRIAIYLDPQADKTLVVEDNGIGIREEDVSRLFEKGFTGYNGRLDKRSTGIGLYLCRRILGRLGNTITIDSRQGAGTAVRLDLSRQELEVE